MPYARVDDLQMYYEALGPSEGVPVVLLHGAGGTIDDPVGGWMALAPSFADDFRVIVVEHRGHGRTNNPVGSLTFEQIADDVTAHPRDPLLPLVPPWRSAPRRFSCWRSSLSRQSLCPPRSTRAVPS